MTEHSAAKLLDALSDWILTRASDPPKPNRYEDGAFLRAVEKSQNIALSAFRLSGAFSESLAAAQHGFDQELARHVATEHSFFRRRFNGLLLKGVTESGP